MKQHTTSKERILGRRVAREMTHEQVERAAGGAHASAPTTTFRYPPDKDRLDEDSL